jgi:hypothetical protein
MPKAGPSRGSFEQTRHLSSISVMAWVPALGVCSDGQVSFEEG